MRAIKFRGKRLIDGKWIYGVPYLDGGWHIMIDSNTATPEEGTGSWSIDPATVGQFTGLTDKNGKEIFEGDIVQYDPYVCDEIIVAEVRYSVEDGRLYIVNDEQYISEDYDCDSARNSVIIGNIHEHKHLLK